MSRDIWGTSTASGGTFLTCAWHRGCSALFQGTPFTNARRARTQARAEGWLCGMEGGVRIGMGRYARLDYCPQHAPRERERRHMRPARKSLG